MSAANAALVDTGDPERRRLLAMRAAFGLSGGIFLAYASDPLGDLPRRAATTRSCRLRSTTPASGADRGQAVAGEA